LGVLGKVEPTRVSVVPPSGGECVLVVEDDHAVRSLACQALRRSGYETHEAASPDEALAQWPELNPRPVILLTDVVMPKLSGKELYERLVALAPTLRVLYMSGYSGDTISHHGMLEKGVILLQKPFAIEELMRKMRQVIDLPATHKNS